jgi:hypothetical protein
MTREQTLYDLPPQWDGQAVEWGAWTAPRTTLALHLPADQLACDKCGVLDEREQARGFIVQPPGSITRMYARGALYAARCRHCGHDTITDLDTGEVWDLEPEDYGPQGSTPPGQLF